MEIGEKGKGKKKYRGGKRRRGGGRDLAHQKSLAWRPLHQTLCFKGPLRGGEGEKKGVRGTEMEKRARKEEKSGKES